MTAFLFGALLLNGGLLLAFAALGRRVAAWPLPGLWWLGAGWLVIELTLLLAEATLP